MRSYLNFLFEGRFSLHFIFFCHEMVFSDPFRINPRVMERTLQRGLRGFYPLAQFQLININTIIIL